MGEPAFKGFLEGQLVAFDREQVVAALVVENLPRGVRLGVERVGQHEFARQIQLLQQPARGRDFVALRGRYDAAQKPARRVYGVDGFHAGVPDFFAIDDDDPVLRRSPNQFLSPPQHPLQRVVRDGRQDPVEGRLAGTAPRAALAVGVKPRRPNWPCLSVAA